MEHPKPKQWELLSLVQLLAGLYWLVAQEGGAWLFWAFVPGSLLLASGVATLLFPGDPRITGVMALGGVAGVLLFLPAWIAGDFPSALLALLGSVAGFLTSGRLGLLREPVRPGAEPPEIGLKMDAKTALDEIANDIDRSAKRPTVGFNLRARAVSGLTESLVIPAAA